MNLPAFWPDPRWPRFFVSSIISDSADKAGLGLDFRARIFPRAITGWVCIVLGLLLAGDAFAGGGVILRNDICIIKINFYEAHFTAYQPETSGNEEFCEDLPDTGRTIFVLDYLHNSLKEVPVDFRVIKDVTGLGPYVRLEHIDAIEDIERHTVFYQPPIIRRDASLKIEHTFAEKGDYVGIVTAGHPTKDETYSSVFPFTVGAANYSYLLTILMVLTPFVIFYFLRRRSGKPRTGAGET